MNARQKIALATPCARAPETIARRFAAAQQVRGDLLSSLLTVNK